MKKYEFIDHTADIGVRVFGNTLEEIFINAVSALSALLVERASGEEKEKPVSLEAETSEDLLVAWLNELIFLFFTSSFLCQHCEVKLTDEDNLKRLKGVFKGIDIDLKRTTMKVEVKAATYHNLHIIQDERGYSVTVIFDI